MKNRIVTAFAALWVFTGAFFMPGKAYADSGDVTPPVLHTELSGGILHIQAYDSGSGVDAVYVGGRRINYRVDGTVDVELEEYVKDTDETVEVYAVDFAGNQSETTEVANPYFALAADLQDVSVSMDSDTDTGTDAEPIVFTPDGRASVTDHAAEEDGKEFYTFTTPEGNVFYLVIDTLRDSDHVYFLNAVTEQDLYALAEKNTEEIPDAAGSLEKAACICTDKCTAGNIHTSCPVCLCEFGACTGKEAEPPEEETEKPDSRGKGKKESSMALILILAGAAAAAGWYLKIYKPKRELDNAEDLDDLLDDEPEVNEDDAEEKTMDGQNIAGFEPGADRDAAGFELETEKDAAGFGPETEKDTAGLESDIEEDAAAYDDYPEDAWTGDGVE